MRAGALHREERAWRRTWKLLGAILAAGHPQALGDKEAWDGVESMPREWAEFGR